jgi:hypothetical protein
MNLSDEYTDSTADNITYDTGYCSGIFTDLDHCSTSATWSPTYRICYRENCPPCPPQRNAEILTKLDTLINLVKQLVDSEERKRIATIVKQVMEELKDGSK